MQSQKASSRMRHYTYHWSRIYELRYLLGKRLLSHNCSKAENDSFNMHAKLMRK
jgi:hypothetical protein